MVIVFYACHCIVDIVRAVNFPRCPIFIRQSEDKDCRMEMFIRNIVQGRLVSLELHQNGEVVVSFQNTRGSNVCFSGATGVDFPE